MKIATLQKFTGGEVSCMVDGVYQSDFTTPEEAQAWLEAHHAERVHDGKPYIKNGKNDIVSGRWEVDDDADEVISLQPEKAVYSVLVGNIGWVLSERDGVTSKDAARELYESYVHMSKTGEGSFMVYKEQVSLWSSDDPDPIETYEPPVTYRVLVGDLGMVVQECTDYDTAKRDYDFYIEESKQNTHARGYQERVELWSSENNDDPVEWYEPETDDDATMHECKFCHCLDAVDSAHSCTAFTDAGNAPDDTPEHKLWEAVMNGIDTGFVNIDGSEE